VFLVPEIVIQENKRYPKKYQKIKKEGDPVNFLLKIKACSKTGITKMEI
jgi:hypothetical protein